MSSSVDILNKQYHAQCETRNIIAVNTYIFS